MKRKKIAFIIDTRGWAFDNIANQLKKQLPEYDIDIIPGATFEGNMIKMFLFCQDYDLLHFLWRGYLSLIDRKEMHQYIYNLGTDFEEFINNFVLNKKITFSVCDFLYLRGEEKWRTDEIFKYATSYFVTSRNLFEIYNNKSKKPWGIIHDGVDLNQYIPENLNRFNNIQKIRIGWVGNSKFRDSDGDEDLKGVETIIKPAVEELKEEGYNIELNLADRNIKFIPQEEMNNYYNNIDLYICASKTEGTPLPILEAMATGIPIISTNVGIVDEVFGNNQKKYILDKREKECLKEKIKSLITNKNDFKILSSENLEQVKGYSWNIIGKRYRDFFLEVLREEEDVRR